MSDVKLYHGDCLDILPTLPDRSVDMILADPPFGTTACGWDSIIPFEPMWEQLKRVVKKNGAIALFGSQPFTSALVMSNPKMFKYEWVWNKKQGSSPLNANFQPNKIHENILIFSKASATYSTKESMVFNPQKTDGHKPYISGKAIGDEKYHGFMSVGGTNNEGDRFPTSIQQFKKENGLHPTQKPVALMEYLIKTYSSEGETVLDFVMGSGTTGVACVKTNRNFIGIEKELDYFEIAKRRIEEAQAQPALFYE